MPIDIPTYAGGQRLPASSWNQVAEAVEKVFPTTEGGIVVGGAGEVPTELAVGADAHALVSTGTTRVNRRLAAWDVTWSGATAFADGTAHASMTDSAQAIRAAIAKAKTLGLPVVGRGTYRVDSNVTIDTDADFVGATFVCNDTAISPLVRVGTAVASTAVRRLTAFLPACIQAAKVVGAGWTGASVGVELSNLARSRVFLGRVQGFTTGLRLTTVGTMGCDYNGIYDGHLDNNKINCHLTPADTNGWTNENTFDHLSCSHESAEGVAVAGTRHILLTGVGTTQPNNNLWVKASLESPGVVAFQVESIGGIFNRWLQCRWEHSGGNPKVWWNQYDVARFSRDNFIDGGYNASAIVYTISANSIRNRVETEFFATKHASSATVTALRLGNAGSDAGPQIEGVDLSVDPLAAAVGDWRWRDTANARAVKAKADTVPRWSVSTALGVHSWGDGSAAADTILYRNGPNHLKTDDKLTVALELEVDGALNHDGTTAGFMGATPVTQRTLPAAATDPATTQALANALRQALIDLGLAV